MLIAIMVAIVVGVNLIPIITEVTNNVTQGENPIVEPGSAVSALAGVLPYVFAAFILLGAVAWIGGIGLGSEEKEERREKVKSFFGNAKDVILRIEKSSKNWSQYLNNLDSLLGIKTINDVSAGSEYGLSLNKERELYIHPSYDWYVVDKYPDKDIFKVVGLHKEDANLNRVYLLGIDEKKNKPFLAEVPARLLELDCKHCLNWATETKAITV